MTHFLVDLALHYPKVVGVMGFLLAVVFGVMGVSSYMEMQKIGDEPHVATLASIVTYLNTNDRYWVNVQDGTFDVRALIMSRSGRVSIRKYFWKTPISQLPCW